MSRPRFTPEREFERALQHAPQMSLHLQDAARAVADEVRAAAPVGDTGNYRRSVKADGGRVVSEDPFWHLVEFGSQNNPPYAPLRRGVRAAGVRLDESTT